MYQTYFQNNTPISKLTSEFRKGTSKSMATENSEKVVTREPSKRERKEVKRLDDDYVPAEKKGFTVPEGEGTPLGDIEVISWYIEKVPGKHDLLKACHRLFYGSDGPKMQRKKQLRQFKGFPAGSSMEEKLKEKLSKSPWTVLCLKDLCKFFDLDWKAGDKDQLIERCVNFLMKPTATKMTSLDALNESRKKKVKVVAMRSAPSKKRKQSSKKTKSSSSAKKKKKKQAPSAKAVSSAPAAKKARPAVVIYATAQKAEIKAKNPTLDKKALGKLVLDKWRGLSPDERKIWEDKAAAEKKAIEEENAVMDIF